MNRRYHLRPQERLPTARAPEAHKKSLHAHKEGRGLSPRPSLCVDVLLISLGIRGAPCLHQARRTRRTKTPPAISPAPKPSVSSESISLAAGGRRLVDLLVTGGRARGAHVDVRADLLELKLVGGGAVLEYVGHGLGVTGVANALDAYALVGVVALAGDGERLIELAALAFLLGLLADLGYGRDGRQSQHSQKRCQ